MEVVEDGRVTVRVETVAVDARSVFEEAEESGFGVAFLLRVERQVREGGREGGERRSEVELDFFLEIELISPRKQREGRT